MQQLAGIRLCPEQINKREVTTQYIPHAKYADTVCAFRTECSKYLNTEDKYVSTGWTLWEVINGEIEYSVDDSLRHGYAHHVLLLAPQDVIRIHYFTEDLKVSVLCVEESLMNSAMRTNTSKQKLLTLPVLMKRSESVDMHHAELNEKARMELHYIFSMIIGRVPPTASLDAIELVMPLVEAMVLIIIESIGVSLNSIRPESRMEKLATDFMESLPINYLKHQDVEFYASQACVSVKYFTAVVKKMTYATPVEWINRMLTTKARELLWLTDMTVNHIADELKFSSPSVFIRFFRRRVGCTPERYKDLQKLKHRM